MQKAIMFALLLACGSAQAAEWVSLGKTAAEEWDALVKP